jgi:hypothetical protein
VQYTYDTNFWVTSRVLDGDPSSRLSLTYDNDGLLTAAGALQRFNDPANGQLAGTQLANVDDSYDRNEFGEASHYSAAFGSWAVLDETLQRDTTGRITQKTEQLGDPITHATETHV